MPTSIRRKFGAGIALACFIANTHAQMANTHWRAQVMDLQHKVKSQATIRLTDRPESQSCMAGNWKQAVVEKEPASGETFFPFRETLAYQINNGELIFGRIRVCDGYQFLSGKVHSKIIRGTYHAPGPGYDQKLGYFSLTRIP